MVYTRPGAREPFFGDVPGVVLGLAGAITLTSALVMLGPPIVSNFILATCVLLVRWPEGELAQPLGPYAPYALHALVHGGWLHLGLNMAGLAAFGAATARRLRSPLLFLAFFFLCTVAGGLAEAAAPSSAPKSIVGASSGVFGLVAGATYARLARGGPLPSLVEPALLAGLAPWAAINLLIPLLGGGAVGYGAIAWVAHLGGLAAGALTFPVFDRLARG